MQDSCPLCTPSRYCKVSLDYHKMDSEKYPKVSRVNECNGTFARDDPNGRYKRGDPKGCDCADIMALRRSTEFCTCEGGGRFGQKKHRKCCYICGEEFFCSKHKGRTGKPKKLSECKCDASCSLARNPM